MVRRFHSYLSGDGRIAAGIVLAYALALSFLVGRSWVERLPQQYDPDFGNAPWIQMHGSPPATYFRKSLYLPDSVDRGWLQVAATGMYVLYVNNVLLDTESLPGVRVSGVYDLKPLLSRGKNVIAIRVPPGQYSGPPQIRVRGAYRVVNAPVQEFISDSSWKVSPTPDGITGSHAWSSAILDDRLWGEAEEGVNPERFSTLQQLTFDPRLLEETHFANWIMPRQERASYTGSQVSFHYDLRLASGYTETWLQVAANGGYDLLVNGHLAGMAPTPARALLVGQLAPVDLVGQVVTTAALPRVVTPWMPVAGNRSLALTAVPATPPPSTVAINPTNIAPNQPDWIPTLTGPTGVSAPELSAITQPPAAAAIQLVPLLSETLGSDQATLALTAYDISGLVRTGNNSVVIRVRCPVAQGPALLLAEGLTTGTVDGTVRRFGTDGSWTTIAQGGALGPSPAEPAVVVARAGKAPWGPLPQVKANAQWLPQRDLRFGFRWLATAFGCTAFVTILWWCAAPLFARGPTTAEQLWTLDAFVQLPMLLVLLALFGSTYDMRLAYDWCFRPAIAGAFLLLLPVSKLALLTARSRNRSGTSVATRPVSIEKSRLWVGLALAGITLIGFVVRAWGLTEFSMAHDEVAMVMMAQGVLKTGLPHIVAGSFVKYPTTYEIVPYPMALSTLLLGHNVIAYRLPSLIFGTCTIFLIGWAGYRMMNWRVGLVAAFIYAFLPTTIGWAQDAFYLSEESFYSLLATWLFFEAICGPELRRRYLTWSTAAAVLAYLTWEGSGFILPTLFVAILVLRWGDFRWMTDRHLWACFLVASAAVLIQLSYRQLAGTPDYLGVVFDLSELSTPSLIFRDRIMFSPLFYIQNFFFADNHSLLTLIVLVGLPFAWRNRALLYLYILLGLYYVWYSGFLASYAPRYCFFWTSVLVLAASGTFFHLWDRIAALDVPRPGVAIRRLALAAGAALLLLGPNPYVTKLYRMTLVPGSPAYLSRLGVRFKPDYRSADRYVGEHLKPGDAVITGGPHVFQFDLGKPPNYWLDSALAQRLTYDGGFKTPFYIDKWLGIPTIRSLQDLQDVNARYGRVFIYQTGALMLNSPDVVTYLAARGHVVHEGYQQSVILIPGATPDEIPQVHKVQTQAP